MIQTLLNALTAAAAIAAVFVAWRGLRTWQMQLQGTAEYELARRVLRAVLEMRNQISAVRNAVIWPTEAEQAKKEHGTNHSEAASDNVHQLAYGRRWSALVRARSKLSLELLEAEVLWGDSIRRPEKMLDQCVGELWIAVNRHLREMSGETPARREFTREVEEQWLKSQAILYEDNPARNEFTN